MDLHFRGDRPAHLGGCRPAQPVYNAAVCTLALLYQQSAHRPVVVAANRDEFLDRACVPPMVIEGDPWIACGLDLVAGGTWLGLNRHGLVVGVLNRRTAQPVDPRRQSRGLLCLEALRRPSVDAALAYVERQSSAAYNPFNLLLASVEAAFVVQNIAGEMIVTPLPPGVHLLTNLDLNDPTCPRIAKSLRGFEAIAPKLDQDPEILIALLRHLLSDHSLPLDPRSAGPPNNLCVHLDGYGTRSSSIIIGGADPASRRFFHADGPPCRTPYAEVALPSAG
jgi:uncharacterized protein with NRDE domain